MGETLDIRKLKTQFEYKPPDLVLSTAWQNVLWREWHHSEDKPYVERLYKSLTDQKQPSNFVLRSEERPFVAEVEFALRVGCKESSAMRNVWQRRLDRLDDDRNKSVPKYQLVNNLEHNHWLERFLTRHILVYWGGDAVKTLQQADQVYFKKTRETIDWILQSIGADTKFRLAQKKDDLLCPNCLVRCGKLVINTTWQSNYEYYGCRACGQSQEFLNCPYKIVAVIDTAWDNTFYCKNQMLCINYLMYQSIFDFDRVEIVQANDEVVERFAMHVGNDTDPFRRPRYSKMRCKIGAECGLSKNSQRILTSIFGQVT